MKYILLLCFLAISTHNINGLLSLSKKPTPATGDNVVRSNVKIYSNLAEIIRPLGLLPIEFSAEDWSDIRPDSVTLVGTNVTITQQTITEKKKSLDNTEIYVRSPTSSNTETKFIKATLIDEKRNLVKLIDKDISKEPIFFTPPLDHIVYESDPPQSKYYVNFIYDTTDAVYVSYLRSNLNWKTRYQLNLFDGAKNPVLISMADIRNDGQSKVDIDHAELLGGDINLQMSRQQYYMQSAAYESGRYGSPGAHHSVSYAAAPPPTIGTGEELSGLYVYAINQPFSIEAKTNYILPMFRPHITVDRYISFHRYFYGTAGNSTGKGKRSYRLTSDRFLTSGQCIIRESDRLVGETALPDLAAKDKHEFSLGEDSDVIYKANMSLISSRTYNVTLPNKEVEEQTDSVFDANIYFKNFKKNRPVKIEYEQYISSKKVKLLKSNPTVTHADTTIKHTFTIEADGEKTITYRIDVVT